MENKKDYELVHIDEPIKLAIMLCLKEDFNNIKKRMAEKIGVRDIMVGHWIREQRTNMKPETWEKLYPVIEKHLKNKDAFIPILKNPDCSKICEKMEPFEIDIMKRFKELETPSKMKISTDIDILRKEELKNKVCKDSKHCIPKAG